MKATDIRKSKEEQLKDFENIISFYATDNCPLCFGRGFQGWNETEGRYIPCTCLKGNIEKEMAKLNISEADKQGILSRFRDLLGMN